VDVTNPAVSTARMVGVFISFAVRLQNPRMAFVAVNPRFVPLCEQLSLRTAADFVRRFGEGVAAGEKAVVVRQSRLQGIGSEPIEIFYKQYECGRSRWAYWVRPSKARTEFNNYAVFRELGLNSAECVACGEQRDLFGRLLRAFIITVAIRDALPLNEFVARHCSGRDSASSCAIRDSLCAQLARMTRIIHRADFFHHDLVWRNVLVTSEESGPKVWWIDCPSGGFVRLFQHISRLRDLASLDKLASKFCTRAERVRFLRVYLDQPRLKEAGKRLARAALDYRRKRWPEDWDE
jgi:tRNA A-37 threonylcarbamoyl transferase component Bud32